jgi:pimeloyl-ACP methyl ester carboxylesterase
MLHGWMDVSASFQFAVDALGGERWIVAPDWRGYGLSDPGATDNFWFPDYLADLDALLDHLCPEQSIDLVGHSMGGHVAMLYSGIRPERIRRLVNLEGFGMAATVPAQAPGRYAQWMDQLRQLKSGDMALRPYADQAGVAQRLMKNNPRLSPDKAQWLAQHWAEQQADGQWIIRGHPAHKVVNAQLYQVEETKAVYQRISAPTLVVHASDDSLQTWWKGKYGREEFHQRASVVPQLQHVTVPDTGHMLHHDQPQALAELIEAFLAAP